MDYWYVRLFIRGAGMINCLSRVKPERRASVPKEFYWEPVLDTHHGDTIGPIEWGEVCAISCRKVPQNVQDSLEVELEGAVPGAAEKARLKVAHEAWLKANKSKGAPPKG